MQRDRPNLRGSRLGAGAIGALLILPPRLHARTKVVFGSGCLGRSAVSRQSRGRRWLPQLAVERISLSD
jgi:hypothetical protein